MDKETMDIIQSVPKEVWLQLYNDTTHPMLRQFGRLGEDLAKTLRLITLPIQCTAYVQDRVDRGFTKALSDIPEERRVMPPEGMALDIVEKLKYHSSETILGKLYIDLLSASMDKDRSQLAHPAFLPIIGQLSSDEAFFLHRLSESNPSSFIRPKNGWEILTEEKRNKQFGNASFPIDGQEVKFSDMLINPEEFFYPENFYIYIDHLNKLGLLEYANDDINKHSNKWRELRAGELDFFFIRLSKFGHLFYSCCTNGLSQAKF
ncbi:DUF4393 domain-containing protein [Klebsiella pneumoniae]|uniref:DUF4393 domain-containing protein n=1 Tax=Klebsiella pneumoniae TaxID=573 RepID=UPI003459FAB9